MSRGESLGTQKNLALCTCLRAQSSLMDTQAVKSGVLGPGHREQKTAVEVPALGGIRKGAGAGRLQAGPGLCQLLWESREGAGTQEILQRGEGSSDLASQRRWHLS